MLMMKLIEGGLNAAFGSFMGPSATTPNSAGTPAGSPGTGTMYAAHGAVFDAGNVIPFARGGVVDRPVIFPMARRWRAAPA
jgi:hypothetical protein